MRKKDYKTINKKKCMVKGCDWEGYGIINQKFLCELHFREIKPKKERKFRYQLTRGIMGDKFRVNLNNE